MGWSPVPDMASPGRPARVALALTALLAGIQLVSWVLRPPPGLGDTDDALRLVIVCDLLGGRGWFDTHIARLQSPGGLDMHWSRLVDGGLAGLERLFALVLPPGMAEMAMRGVWPLLWLFPFVLGTVLIGRRLSGSLGVLAGAIFLASYPVLMQFAAGRIDHHNVQMALAMLALAGTVHLDTRWGPWLAGVCTGLGLAVGLEALIFMALCGVAVGIVFIADRDSAPAVRRYALGLAGAVCLAFLAQTPPRLWGVTACDVLAVNLLAGLLTACLGLLLASFANARPSWRGAGVAATGLAALAVYLAADPACAAGPFGHIDPALRPIWLDHVIEVRTWPALLRSDPVPAFALAVPVAMALAVLPFVLRHHSVRRDPAWLIVLAVFLASTLSGLLIVRMLGYAAAFAALILAGAAPRLLPARVLRSLILAVVALFAVSPAVATAVTLYLVAGQDAGSQAPASAAACRRSASYAALRSLPAAPVLADIDYGPDILAHTALSVLAAPYHRMQGIATAHDLWAAPAGEAVARLREHGVGYVMLCPGRAKLPFTFPDRSLRSELEGNIAPPGLESVPAGEAFRVWHIR